MWNSVNYPGGGRKPMGGSQYVYGRNFSFQFLKDRPELKFQPIIGLESFT